MIQYIRIQNFRSVKDIALESGGALRLCGRQQTVAAA